MLQVQQFVGSVISSYLGPCKSKKLVVDEESKDTSMIECPVLLLQKMKTKDHVSHLIEETLTSHHELYGCSSISLLTMWHLWSKEFQLALQEGCEITDVMEHSQNILEFVISHLSDIIILCDETFLKKDVLNSRSHQLKKSENSFCQSKKQFLGSSCGKYNRFNKSSNKLPIGIQYSSRHFSPSQLHTVEEQEARIDNTDKGNYESNFLIKFVLTEKIKCSMHSLVEKLSHGTSELTNLVYNAWICQIETSNSIEFNIDGIVICPVTLPSYYSKVVGGLVIKSDTRYIHNQDLSIEKCRALIIKGSITFEYTHLGYSQDVHVTLKKSPKQLQVSAKDIWIKKCCDLLLDLEINCLLVTGEVDPDIARFCLSKSIFLLSCIVWSHLQDLCVAVNKWPSDYILECDSENVISNLKIKKWKFEGAEMNNEDFFIHIDISNPKSTKIICSVILCHPNQLVLTCQEHQFWHLASRLHLGTKENKLLPGGGKTEKWCSDFLQKWPFENETQKRIKSAIQRGFLNYFKVLSENMKSSSELCNVESVDEMQSKTQAWRSAMAMILVLLQCDCLIVNGCEGSILEDNLIGFL